MATKLGSVWMSFRLDTADAQKDLDKLQAKPGQPQKQKPALVKAANEIPGVGKPNSEIHRDNYLKQLSAAALKGVGGAMAQNQAAATLTGVTGQVAPYLPAIAGQRAGGAFVKALGVAGKAALGYGVLSTAIKTLGEAQEFGNKLFGMDSDSGILAELKKLYDALAAKVEEVEQKIISVVESVSVTSKYSKAAERLTGRIPDTNHYFDQTYDVLQAERRVAQRFERWKSQEAPFNMTRTLFDLFKRGISR